MTRRGVLLGGGVLAVAGTVGTVKSGVFYSAISERRKGGTLNAQAASDAVETGDVILIDIRRPDEWDATGRPSGSVALDMRRADFIDELTRIARGDKSAPIALICARGVRSARVANRLVEAGFTGIVDVPEGMLGSAAGPGWLARGLPLETD